METFSARLLSFHPGTTESGSEGEADAGTWPITTIRSVDMAGAGFFFTGSDKNPDSVTCHSCKLQAWKWESKDDPFAQHKLGSPNCDYTATDEFENCHRVFLARQEAKQCTEEVLTPPPTPAKPLRKPRGPSKKKVALSKIMTVCNFEPSYTQDGISSQQEVEAKPVEIAIASGGSKITIKIDVDGSRDGGSYMLRYISDFKENEFALTGHDDTKKNTLLDTSKLLQYHEKNMSQYSMKREGHGRMPGTMPYGGSEDHRRDFGPAEGCMYGEIPRHFVMAWEELGKR